MTAQTDIVPMEEDAPKAKNLTAFPGIPDPNDPLVIRAKAIIDSGEIPESAIKTHPGAGGKTFKYIKHTWISRMMNAAFGPYWSWQVLDVQVQSDDSGIARVQMDINYPYYDQHLNITFFRRTITEIGAFVAQEGAHMKKSNIAASAVSRGLARCFMRAFNVGAKFYEEDGLEEITNKSVWNEVARFADRNDINRDTMIAALKTAGITRDDLAAKRDEVWRIVNKLKRPEEEVPEAL